MIIIIFADRVLRVWASVNFPDESNLKKTRTKDFSDSFETHQPSQKILPQEKKTIYLTKKQNGRFIELVDIFLT